jgi:hypothetical protein
VLATGAAVEKVCFNNPNSARLAKGASRYRNSRQFAANLAVTASVSLFSPIFAERRFWRQACMEKRCRK